MFRNIISVVGLILILGGVLYFIGTLKMMFRYFKSTNFTTNHDIKLRFPKKQLLFMILSLSISFLNMGVKWYELIINAFACFCMFYYGVSVYTYFMVTLPSSALKLKRPLYFLLIFSVPILSYFGIRLYFPFISLW